MSTEAVVAVMVAAAAGYLVGSVPFGYVVARAVHGIDIRRHGSGNIGATNVGRVLGGKWFAAVFVLDFLKGLAPTLAIPPAARALVGDASIADSTTLPVAAGLAAIGGHMWPIWLRLRGGKGVATSLGVVVVLDPPASLAAAGVWLLVLAATRIVSVASMVASIAFAAAHFALSAAPAPFGAEQRALSILTLLIPVLVIARHRANLARLARGEEPRLRSRASSEGTGQEGTPTAGARASRQPDHEDADAEEQAPRRGRK